MKSISTPLTDVLTLTEYAMLRETKTMCEMQIAEAQKMIDEINERLAENKHLAEQYESAKAMCDWMCN